MLFDELSLGTIKHDGQLYINVEQLSTHLANAIHGIAHEFEQANRHLRMPTNERMFIGGILQGMANIVLLLDQGSSESAIEDIETVNDLIERFKSG